MVGPANFFLDVSETGDARDSALTPMDDDRSLKPGTGKGWLFILDGVRW